MKKRALQVAKNTLIVLAIGIIYYLFCELTDLGFKCIIYSLTGFLCPSCGLTRMCKSLIKLDFSSAFYYNPAIMILSPLLISVIISYSYRYIKNGENKLATWHKILLSICIAALFVFGILRNIAEIGLSPNFINQ